MPLDAAVSYWCQPFRDERYFDTLAIRWLMLPLNRDTFAISATLSRAGITLLLLPLLTDIIYLSLLDYAADTPLDIANIALNIYLLY